MRPFFYPAYLLRAVPTERLIGVALLRIGRQLSLVIQGNRDMPPEEEILREHGAHRVEALPATVEGLLPGSWTLADPGRIEGAARSLWERAPGEAELGLAVGRRILEGIVEIFGRRVPVPRLPSRIPLASPGWRAVNWERCPLTGRHFAAGLQEGMDPKNAWALGRLEQVVQLAIAHRLALVAGDPDAEKFAQAAIDWSLDATFAPKGVQWSCPMEVALRGANVAMAVRLLAGTSFLGGHAEALCQILRGLEGHAVHVGDRLEDTVVVPNNHLVANHVGLLVIGALFPRLRRARRLAREKLSPFFRLLMEQTLEDGFTFEGSVGYHRLAVELFLLGALAAEGLGRFLRPNESSRLLAMFRASASLVDGSGETPQIGDADSGRALPFRSRGARDHGHLDALGRRFFGAELRRGESASPEATWLLGGEGPRRLQRLPAGGGPISWEGSEGRDGVLPQAGIFVLRSKRITCSIACGPNGTGGTGSHGHNDKLSLEICVDGERVVADPGTGVYTADPSLRNRFRGTAWHSTARVDGKEQQDIPRDRLFALPEQARARCLVWDGGREAARFIGEHHGYERLPRPVLHRREVVLHRAEERIDVCDTFLGLGFHEIEIRYILPFSRRDIGIRELDPTERSGSGPSHRWVAEVLQRERSIAILAGQQRPDLEEASYAEGYGQIRAATVVVFRWKGTLPATVRTMVSPGNVRGKR